MKVVLNNNKIKNCFDGSGIGIDIQPIDTIIEVPYGFTCKEGDDIRMWDEKYNLRNAEDLIIDGYIVLLPTQKIVDHKIVEKTFQEQFDDGTYIPEEGYTVYNNQLLDMNGIKAIKQKEINIMFNNASISGHFISQTIGIDIDCRRTGEKNDVQNVEGLIDIMIAYNKPTEYYKGISETKADVTVEQFQAIKLEMIAYGLALYQKKHEKENLINAATTFEEIKAITWE
jgi:hypothetical protein